MPLSVERTATNTSSSEVFENSHADKTRSLNEIVKKINTVQTANALTPLSEYSKGSSLAEKIEALRVWFCEYLAVASPLFHETYKEFYNENSIDTDFVSNIVSHVRNYFDGAVIVKRNIYFSSNDEDQLETTIAKFATDTAAPFTPQLQAFLANSAEELSTENMLGSHFSHLYYDIYCGNSLDKYTDTPKETSNYIDYIYGLKTAAGINNPDLFALLLLQFAKVMPSIESTEYQGIFDNREDSQLFKDVSKAISSVFYMLDLDCLFAVTKNENFDMACRNTYCQRPVGPYSSIFSDILIRAVIEHPAIKNCPKEFDRLEKHWMSIDKSLFLPRVTRLSLPNESHWLSLFSSDTVQKSNDDDFLKFVTINYSRGGKIESDEIVKAIVANDRVISLPQEDQDKILLAISEPCIARNIELILSSPLKDSYLYQLDLSNIGIALNPSLLELGKFEHTNQSYSRKRKNKKDPMKSLASDAIKLRGYQRKVYIGNNSLDDLEFGIVKDLFTEVLETQIFPWVYHSLKKWLSSEDLPPNDKSFTIIYDFLVFFCSDKYLFDETGTTETFISKIKEILNEESSHVPSNDAFDAIFDSREISGYIRNHMDKIIDFLQLIPSNKESKFLQLSQAIFSYLLKRAVRL